MIGLLILAARLAEFRVRAAGDYGGLIYFSWSGRIGVASRQYAKHSPRAVPCSVEYYKIIDRIARGEQP